MIFSINRIAIIFLALFLSSCLSSIDKGLMKVSNSVSVIDPVTGKREISFESKKQENIRADKQAKSLLADFKKKGLKIDAKNKDFYRTQKVFNRLKKVVHRQGLNWEIHLIENKSWNAFTIGGGKIFVYTGLFQGRGAVQNDDELAAILAHEMAHINARHASEAQGKLLASKLVDKKLRTDSYQASFTTIQEDEADKYSVIYSALAGYNPKAGAKIWRRMHEVFGSQPANLLYDHPLNKNRALSLDRYGNLASRYYQPNQINAKHQSLLKSNVIFSHRKLSNIKAGEGGGVISILEALGNAYIEAEKAKREQKNRGL
jgi:Zn-dependent protease with chaperone function